MTLRLTLRQLLTHLLHAPFSKLHVEKVPEVPHQDDDETDMTEDEFDAAWERGTPVEAVDWVEDSGLTPEETLARFEALHPQPTQGPRTLTAGVTYLRTFPDAHCRRHPDQAGRLCRSCRSEDIARKDER